MIRVQEEGEGGGGERGGEGRAKGEVTGEDDDERYSIYVPSVLSIEREERGAGRKKGRGRGAAAAAARADNEWYDSRGVGDRSLPFAETSADDPLHNELPLDGPTYKLV
jgi:hypothetical protein